MRIKALLRSAASRNQNITVFVPAVPPLRKSLLKKNKKLVSCFAESCGGNSALIAD